MVSPDGTLYNFFNDDTTAELTDHFLVLCEESCHLASSWRREVPVTDTSFDILPAPFSTPVPGFEVLFLGDYVGPAAGHEEFVTFFSQSITMDDPASANARRVAGEDDGENDRDDEDDEWLGVESNRLSALVR